MLPTCCRSIASDPSFMLCFAWDHLDCSGIGDRSSGIIIVVYFVNYYVVFYCLKFFI